MAKKFINAPDVHVPITSYSHAAVSGNTIYIAAQLPLDEDGNLVGPNNPRVQAEQVFLNLQRVLVAAGGTLQDVVKLTTYLTSLQYRGEVMDVRNQFFGQHRAPSILAVVRALPVEGALLEVDGIAVLN